MNPLNITLVTTRDRGRAERSRWRWLDDQTGIYRLRVRGLLPLRWLNR